MWCSFCTSPGYYRWDGKTKNFEILPKGRVLNVLEVHTDHLLEGNLAAPLQLPKASDPGQLSQSLVMPVSIAGDFVRRHRTRPHKAHVSFQYVQELRQLSHTELPQKSAESRHSGVIGELECPAVFRRGLGTTFDKVANGRLVNRRICVIHHGPGLVHHEIVN